jgi:hypothetical protein
MGWLHSNFILGLHLKQAEALLSVGSTMTRGHDVDTLDRASNTWLYDYLSYPLHIHVDYQDPPSGTRINMC